MIHYRVKWFALAGLVLFLGVALAPSIYADVENSSMIHSSPLFTVRSSRAIKTNSSDIYPEYVNKGVEINLDFPTDNTNMEIIIKIFERLNQLDEKEIQQFKAHLIDKLDKSNIAITKDIDADSLRGLMINLDLAQNKSTLPITTGELCNNTITSLICFTGQKCTLYDLGAPLIGCLLYLFLASPFIAIFGATAIAAVIVFLLLLPILVPITIFAWFYALFSIGHCSDMYSYCF